MANYRAIASGNWSNGATWGGGAVPPNGEGHNIYSNNFTVTIDQNVDVALITNRNITASFVGGGTSAASGGSFTVTASGYEISANIEPFVNSANLINFTAASPAVLTISGNLTPLSVNGSGTNGHALNNASTGTINVNTATISSGTSLSQIRAVNNVAGGQINLNNCTIAGASRIQEAAVYNTGGGVVTATNCTMTSLACYSTSTFVATGCVFTATSGAEAIQATGTVRLSGTFVSAQNGRQPINSAVWILNTTPTASYIQHALDGINANSFVRFYTADNSLGQANPTDVRSGVSYASGNLTGRLTVPARGSVALSVNYGPSMPFTATRSGTTATATLDYSYPLVVGDQITVTGASNSEWNSTYTIASIVSGTSVTFEVPASHSATAGTGATMQTTGTAVLDPAAVASAVWGAATRTITGGLVDTATTLTNAPASVTPADIWSHATRTITGGTVDTLTNAPTVPSASAIASQVRTELTTELGRLDASISSRLADADYTAPTAAPTAAQNASAVRTELSVELARLDAPVSGATAPSAATVASAVRTELSSELTKVSALNTDRLANCATTQIVGTLLAQSQS